MKGKKIKEKMEKEAHKVGRREEVDDKIRNKLSDVIVSVSGGPELV